MLRYNPINIPLFLGIKRPGNFLLSHSVLSIVQFLEKNLFKIRLQLDVLAIS